MYTVYHRQPVYPGLVLPDQDPIPVVDLNWPANYQKVALVEANSLEEVYLKTQHLETVWWHNQSVKAIQMSRSTAIGDVLRDENGNLWVVAAFGFVKTTGHSEESP
jgi:hypothetical protein